MPPVQALSRFEQWGLSKWEVHQCSALHLKGFISNPRIGRPSILAPLSTALGGAFRIRCEHKRPDRRLASPGSVSVRQITSPGPGEECESKLRIRHAENGARRRHLPSLWKILLLNRAFPSGDKDFATFFPGVHRCPGSREGMNKKINPGSGPGGVTQNTSVRTFAELDEK